TYNTHDFFVHRHRHHRHRHSFPTRRSSDLPWQSPALTLPPTMKRRKQKNQQCTATMGTKNPNLPTTSLRVPAKDLHSTSLQPPRSEEHTSELQSRGHLVCRLLLEKKKIQQK